MTTPRHVPADLFAPLSDTPASVVADYARDRSLSGREGGEGGGGLTPSPDRIRSVPLSKDLLERGTALDRAAGRGKGNPAALRRPLRSVETLDAATLLEILRAFPAVDEAGTPRPTYRQPVVLPNGDLLEVSGAGTREAPRVYFRLSHFRTPATDDPILWTRGFLEIVRTTIGGRIRFQAHGIDGSREWATFRYDAPGVCPGCDGRGGHGEGGPTCDTCHGSGWLLTAEQRTWIATGGGPTTP